MPPTTIPRTPKGLAQIPGLREADEQTLAMIVALTSEVTVIRERLDTYERLLVRREIFEPDTIETFVPDVTEQAERDRQRKRTLEKVFRPLGESAAAELAARRGKE